MCPVTGGLALATAVTSASAVAAGTLAATAVATVGAAAIGAGIAVAAGGVMNAASGRGFFEGAGKSALFGAVGGGFAGYAGAGANAASSGFLQGTSSLSQLTSANALASFAPSATSIALGGAAGSVLAGMVPDPLEQFIPGLSPIQSSNQTIATTGSGGKAAAASLAESIKRSKRRKLTQEDVSDLSIDTSSFASSGLQLA